MKELALKIATEAHKGQVDKSGVDYIEHPKKVASMCQNEDEVIVALLHDVVEDTEVSLDDLRDCGFSEEIIDAVDCMTKRKNEEYDIYLQRVKSNKLARIVKQYDMTHNSDDSRYSSPTKEDIARCEKYKQRIIELNK